MFWDHFGDGPLMDDLKKVITEKIYDKAIVKLHGIIPNKEVMEHYRTMPVDLFVNVSSSEGIPVSIMEAQSAGVPVLATDVGGTSEIVNEENGWLISKDARPDEISNILREIISNRSILSKKRLAAKRNWEENFNADTNYREFAKTLTEL
ncbi:MAG: glycosyltransferase [Balneolaceae bacterium]|nr:glycosyltransferase [Balneolaceae bacterium]